MKIVFSPHSLEKMDLLEKHGFSVTKRQVEDAVRDPDKDSKAKKRRRARQKRLGGTHLPRVIYENLNNKKRIINIYPAGRKRYGD